LTLITNRNYQERSLRLVPANPSPKASISDTANSLGLHDTLKYGPRSLADEIKSVNTLQARLENVRYISSYTTILLSRDRAIAVGRNTEEPQADHAS
jgi:proteasome maturation protein